jgi:hypothetical protein
MFGEDMELETLVRLLDYKFFPAVPGWELSAYPKIAKQQLIAEPKDWEPVELDDTEHVLVTWLCEKDEIDLAAPPRGADPALLKTAVERLVGAGLVGPDASLPTVFRLLTKQCAVVCLPDGRVVAGENVSGRLTRWLSRYMEARKTVVGPDSDGTK